MLTLLLVVPLAGAILILFTENPRTAKLLALVTSFINLVISLVIWGVFDANKMGNQFTSLYLSEPNLINIAIGLDGLSIYFVLITTFIIPCCILASWDTIKGALEYTPSRKGGFINPKTKVVYEELFALLSILLPVGKNEGYEGAGVKSFLIALLVLETLLIAIFIVVDLLLFYICFESVLIPLFFLVGIWGQGPNKIKASYYLFLYTLFGSLFMLLAILAIYANVGTTDMLILSCTSFDTTTQRILWLGFFLSFAQKLPLVPLHLWLGLAHTEAPLAGSIILAGILLKLPVYGILRILIPFFPEATAYFTPLVYTLCLITIFYTSLAVLRQVNLKAMIAYMSIGHMSVCGLGLFSNTIQGIEGSIFLSIAHGIVSPALFILVGVLYDRWHTLNLFYYRGVAQMMPFFATLFFVFVLCNMAVPLSPNFIGEFLSFTGAFRHNPVLTVLASSSVVFVAAYSVWFYNRVSFGVFSPYLRLMGDLTRREFSLLLPLLLISCLLGLAPNLILDHVHLAVSSLIYLTPPLSGVSLSLLTPLVLDSTSSFKAPNSKAGLTSSVYHQPVPERTYDSTF